MRTFASKPVDTMKTAWVTAQNTVKERRFISLVLLLYARHTPGISRTCSRFRC